MAYYNQDKVIVPRASLSEIQGDAVSELDQHVITLEQDVQTLHATIGTLQSRLTRYVSQEDTKVGAVSSPVTAAASCSASMQVRDISLSVKEAIYRLTRTLDDLRI